MLSAKQLIVIRTMLICGIVSSLWYVLLNIFVPLQWPAYNSASQTVSELSAIDAPTRSLWIWLCFPYTVMIILFAWGVWKSSGSNPNLHIAGGLMIVYATLGIIWPFAPMHLRKELAVGGATLSDTVHIGLGVVTEVIYLLALGFAAMAFGRWFRLYSIVTFIALLIFGALTFIDAPGVASNKPTPWIGVWERINIGVFLLWVIVLAVILMRKNRLSNYYNNANTLSL
ncbi:DUF998 domain-containing protein [Mucilaginibacter puniceus]